MRLLAGTSGWQYREWKGSFYPEDLATDGMLAYYGERFPAVEVNNTFYRLPKESVLRGWAEQVPDGFRFVLKASRRITHNARLKEGAVDPLAYLLRTAVALGDRLGPILFQLPPNMKKDLPRLTTFLGHLPAGTRAAFEFRHPSWLEEDVVDALSAHDLALCVASTESEETPLHATARYGYLRLRKEAYEEGDLEAWADRIHAQPWEEAYVFFKHEDEGTGPRLAARFTEIWQRRAAGDVQPAP
jgi:uncharacterized protein YecE (DUF72 family)